MRSSRKLDTAPASRGVLRGQALLRALAQEPGYTEPHARVLRAAMQLMAARGYAGASLRALADELRIAQPSLYHYFESKEQLVEQIVRAHAARILRVPEDLPEHATLAEGLRYGMRQLIEGYRDSDRVVFVRFLMAVGHERPQMRALARELLFERGLSLLQAFVAVFVPREIDARDVRPLCEMVVHAMVMKLFSHHALFGDPDDEVDFDGYADFLVDTAVRGVRSRRRSARHEVSGHE
jgi:AcrR family transcriptional regulator